MPTIKKPNFEQLEKRVAARRAAIAKLKSTPLTDEQIKSYDAERERIGLQKFAEMEAKESNIDGEYVGGYPQQDSTKTINNSYVPTFAITDTWGR